MESKTEEWDLIIQPKSSIFKIGIKKLWKYQDLMFLFVKRDLVSLYKQTILGPVWLFIQPLLTTFIYLTVFTNIAKIGTNGIPPILFYLSGITLWTYFSECLSKTSATFLANANVIGKVYFPRLIIPLSIVTSTMLKLGIQLILLIIVWIYSYINTPSFHLTPYILLFPFLIIILAGMGMGIGIIISSLTTKYRDLAFLVGFGLQLFMYATPVVYPLGIVPEQYKKIMLLNPVAPIIEFFRFSITGIGYLDVVYLFYSFACMLLLLGIGVIVFNKVEKSFIDTV